MRLNTSLLSTLDRVVLMPTTDIIDATHIARTTWYRIMQSPETITVQHILSISNGLHIPVRRFFSEGRTDLIGRREDYVTEPYLPCRYDNTALQQLVSVCRDATWQRAADAIGLTRSNLRNSLMAITRTPVTRFLAVCEAFDIDPFTILIDPNPEPKRKRGATATLPSPAAAPNPDVAAEIAGLRREIATLSDAVTDLTDKYRDLLRAHEALARSVQVNIHNFTDSHLSIAAEPVPPYNPSNNE